MGHEEEIQKGGYVQVPDSVREFYQLEVGDVLRWQVGGENPSVTIVEETASTTADANRRDVLKWIAGNVLSGLVGQSAAKANSTFTGELTLGEPTEDQTTAAQAALFGLDGPIGVSHGRGAPELDTLGEIGLEAQAELLKLFLRLRDTAEVEFQDVVDTQAVSHVATTAGPVGSDAVALSMGYDLDDAGKYHGTLPWIFELAPAEEYEGKPFEYLREHRTNWALKRLDGSRKPLTPILEQSGETLPGTDRPKYRVDYGLITVKPVSAGWEQYDRYEGYTALTDATDNTHVIISGCHGEATYAATQALNDASFCETLHRELPPETEFFQAVISVHIDSYSPETDRRGETFYLPTIGNVSLHDAVSLDV